MAQAVGLRQLFQISDTFHGKGKVVFAWNADGTLLCTAGSNGLVHIFNRHGQQVCDVLLESRAQCIALEWDKDGEAVAIIQQKVERVAIWEVASRKVVYIDSGLGDPTWAKWSKVGPQLAIGSGKGALLIFRKDSRKKQLLTGKHSKAITCGDWSTDNKLALGGADVLLTVSNAEGATELQLELKYPPAAVQFAAEKSETYRGRGKGGGAGGEAGGGDTTVSVNMGGNTVLLYNTLRPSEPSELLFQARYGRIVAYRWFGDGYVMLGFSEGYVVVISTHRDEIKEEVFSGRFHREPLEDIACSVVAQKAASAGGNIVKLLDMATWRELKAEFAAVDAAHGPITSLAWTADGQILTAGTRSGHVYAFLGMLPVLVDACGSRIAHVSSLREVSVLEIGPRGHVEEEAAPAAGVPVAVEPAFVAMGPSATAVGLNNRVWYYRLPGSAPAPAGGAGAAPSLLLGERDYVGTVDEVKLSARHAIVRCMGRLYVHELPSGAGGAGSGGAGAATSASAAASIILPERHDGAPVTCMAVAGDFLVYGTAAGRVELFSLADGKTLVSHEYRGSPASEGSAAAPGVRGVFPNALCTRLVLTDDAGRVYLYSPVDTRRILVSAAPAGARRVLWDATDRNVFVVATEREAATYLYCPVTMTGPTVTQLGSLEIQANGDMVVDPLTTPLPPGHTPLMLNGGVLTCYTSSGSVSTVLLATHTALPGASPAAVLSEPRQLRAAFAQSVALLHLQEAWGLALRINERPLWMALSGKAMEVLDLALAQRVYRLVGDAGMVAALEQVARLEDRQAVSGHVALLFGDLPLAQELFLASSMPQQALHMRRDLLQWDVALRLAETLAPGEVPAISLEYGRQLEVKGEWAQALAMFQSAATRLASLPAGGVDAAEAASLRAAVQAGVARMTLRQGDLRRGIAMAAESGDKALCRECAAILESMKQYADAATLYRQAEMWDKAVALLLQAKNWGAAAGLMDKVTAPKLHAIYAKAREASKDYAEAAKAYERARDTDNLVRLLLDHLDAPERAAAIVRQTRSSEGATLLARYCVGAGDFRGGIEFLLLARKRDDAFALASAHGEMALYVQALKMALAATASGLDLAAVLASATAGIEGSGGDAAAAAAAATEAALAGVTLPADECNRIAAWYEGKGQLPAAAAMYAEAEAYGKALKLYLQCGEACIDAAISVVGRARSDAVTHALIDYLMGESDGVPKDPRYIFKLYVALGNFPQAAKTALIIARQEQQLGNYKVAHDVLWETYRDLVQHSVRVPQDLLRGLTLLHSYLLVKRLVKLENHDAAAAMMVRVAAAVSQFPQHVVPILTSTVIECQRAGLKRSAYEYACQLVRPEYRDRVEPKFAKKIEALVRRPSTEEADQGVAPCPFCDRQVPTYQLNCDACKATIPFCIVSGRHMTLEDCSSCTHCKFPALFSSLAAYLTVEPACPMCSTAIMPASIGLVSDPLPFLRRAAAVTGERIAGDAEGDGAAGEEKESESGASASNGVAAAAALAGKPAAGAGKPAP